MYNEGGREVQHAQVRLVITQVRTMPGMHSDRPQEVEATSTHVGVYVGRVHLVTPGRWEVIVKVAAAYSRRWGERGGQLATSILRNFLGTPLWLFGFIEYMEQVPSFRKKP